MKRIDNMTYLYTDAGGWSPLEERYEYQVAEE